MLMFSEKIEQLVKHLPWESLWVCQTGWLLHDMLSAYVDIYSMLLKNKMLSEFIPLYNRNVFGEYNYLKLGA